MITKCKECKKEVSSEAKVCPHCGVKNPGIGFKEMLSGIVFLIAAVYIFHIFTSEDTTTETEQKLSQRESIPSTENKVEKSSMITYRKLDGKEAEDLAYNFCYAVQTSGLCNDLYLREGTEKVIEQKLNNSPRKGPYNQICMQAMSDAYDQENKGLCTDAWGKFGCLGNVEPKLLAGNILDGEFIACDYE